ncbi:MAG: hypothetical protein U0350_49135 [Caldilineaceae bacterium]
MIGLETNIFPIENLDKLSAGYRLYRIKGLRVDQPEYYQNRQYLAKSLSFQLKSPILPIQRDEETYLVVRSDVENFPEWYELVRRKVQFEPASDVLHLDFSVRNPETNEICIRFLQFTLQEALYNCRALWQPTSGHPFYEYTSLNLDNDIAHYRGYSVRVATTQSGGLGILVDVTGKFVSQTPLPAQLTRKQFEQWKSKHLIYHFGHRWYEIQAHALDDRNCDEYEIKDQEQWINLLDYTVEKSQKPIPKELAQVSKDSSVILYRNNQNSDRAAIAPLCYPVFGTDSDERAAKLHRNNIMKPSERRKAIHTFVTTHLLSLRFGNTRLVVSPCPENTELRMFNVPDQRFGQDTIISTIGSEGAKHVSLDHLGTTRKALLRDPSVGFYRRTPLDRQYFVLPTSVIKSYGSAFLTELKSAVEQLYPHGGGYTPIIIEYDDRCRRTFAAQGTAILRAMEEHRVEAGYALVMIHHTANKQYRQEDPLGGMITRELRERFDISAAIIHSVVSGESYHGQRDKNGIYSYQIHPSKRGKFRGYVHNVALSKVLLTNQKWPFVIDKRLHADVTIGIDVKQHTAGFVVVGAGGKTIRSLTRTSRQKERLLEDQVRDYTLEILRNEAVAQSELIKTIVVHRDGRSYQSEVLGLTTAIEILKREGVIHQDGMLTVLEISKSSPVRLRLFDVTSNGGHVCVNNPQVGCYYVVNDRDAFLCSTGRAFQHVGTTQPLLVRHIFGTLGIRDCLEDVYALTTLAWSKPDDCSRYPITIKLCDRYLTEDAMEYDADALHRADIFDEDEGDEQNE